MKFEHLVEICFWLNLSVKGLAFNLCEDTFQLFKKVEDSVTYSL